MVIREPCRGPRMASPSRWVHSVPVSLSTIVSTSCRRPKTSKVRVSPWTTGSHTIPKLHLIQ